MATPAAIENLSLTELQERRDELIESAKAVPVEELAARYVKAVMNAKDRDVVLGDQGRKITQQDTTIAELQASLENLRGQFEIATLDLRQRNADIENASTREATLASKLQEAGGAIRDLRSLAGRRRTALATVMTGVNDLNTKIAPLLADEQ